VFPAWPDRISPPCIVLVPGAPWVDTTEIMFGELRGRIDVHLLAATGGTDESLCLLEEALEDVLRLTAEWAMELVDAPSLISVAGADYIGTTLTLSKPFRPHETD
jgi:hypothetical protein